MTAMNRRDAVKTAGLLLGGAVAVSSGLLTACSNEKKAAQSEPDAALVVKKASLVLTATDQALMEAVADTILPDTPASPGAKAAGAGAAINLLLSDCYEPPAHKRAIDGLAVLRQRSTTFAALPQAARETLLRTIDAEAKQAGDTHWFHLLHELSLKAYYATEIGTTKALRYVREPGRFDGCVKFTPGQPAWA